MRYTSGHRRMNRTFMRISLSEFDRRAVSQDLCYTLCKLSGIISECNHGISTHLLGEIIKSIVEYTYWILHSNNTIS